MVWLFKDSFLQSPVDFPVLSRGQHHDKTKSVSSNCLSQTKNGANVVVVVDEVVELDVVEVDEVEVVVVLLVEVVVVVVVVGFIAGIT